MMSYLEAEIKVCSYFSCDYLYFEPADQHVTEEALKLHEAIFICWTTSEQKYSKCFKNNYDIFSAALKSYKVLYIKTITKKIKQFLISAKRDITHHTSVFPGFIGTYRCDSSS